MVRLLLDSHHIRPKEVGVVMLKTVSFIFRRWTPSLKTFWKRCHQHQIASVIHYRFTLRWTSAQYSMGIAIDTILYFYSDLHKLWRFTVLTQKNRCTTASNVLFIFVCSSQWDLIVIADSTNQGHFASRSGSYVSRRWFCVISTSLSDFCHDKLEVFVIFRWFTTFWPFTAFGHFIAGMCRLYCYMLVTNRRHQQWIYALSHVDDILTFSPLQPTTLAISWTYRMSIIRR